MTRSPDMAADWTRRRALGGLLGLPGLIVPGLVVPGFALIGGCSSGTPTAKTTGLEFAIEADQEINVNTNGEPSPILLRVYELKTKTIFEQASFFELLDGDTTKLGPELVAKREFEVKPGEKSSFTRDSPADAKHVGVIAGFRDIETANWRSVVDIVPDRANAFVVQVTALAVKITLARASRSFGLF